MCKHSVDCDISETVYVQFECPCCDGRGCGECKDGKFRLTECAHNYVGDMWTALKYASLADKHLPQTGGVSDQSAWFIDLWVAYRNDLNAIEQEVIDKWQAT